MASAPGGFSLDVGELHKETRATLHEAGESARWDGGPVIAFSPDGYTRRQSWWNQPLTEDPNSQRAVNQRSAASNGMKLDSPPAVFDSGYDPGSAAGSVWQARKANAPIDLERNPSLSVSLTVAPAMAVAGDPVSVNLTVWSSRPTEADAIISAGGKLVGSKRVSLRKGANLVQVEPIVETAGPIELSGVISTPELERVTFSTSLVVQRPRALIISAGPHAFEATARKALERRFDAVHTTSIPDQVEGYQIIALEQPYLETISAESGGALEEFVRRGGGLIVIGGRDGGRDPLKRVPPSTGAIPASPACVVLVLEKSGAMEGLKIELAKLASRGLVENLRRKDQLGVLTFNDTFTWAVPIRDDRQKDVIDHQIEEIATGGGTRIAPALAEAIQRITPVNAVSKHIVLLTDGISEDSATLPLARMAALRRVTVSAVALGENANREYLNNVAMSGHGESLSIKDPFDVDSGFLSDVITYTSLPDTDIGRFEVPAMGFNPYRAADDDSSRARVIRRRHGQGAAVFVFGEREAALSHRPVNGQEELWSDQLRYLVPRQREATITYDSERDDLVVEHPTGLNLTASAPGGRDTTVKLERSADGVFRGRVPCGRTSGVFRIRPRGPALGVAEMVVHRQQEDPYGAAGGLEPREMSGAPRDRNGLHSAGIVDRSEVSIVRKLEAWPWLLIIALTLGIKALMLHAQKKSDRIPGLSGRFSA